MLTLPSEKYLSVIFGTMTALERKHHSEKLLSSLGITLTDNLPPIEEENSVTLRSPKEVAERILILSYLSCVATDPSLQQPVMVFLIHEGLWDKATGEEKALFHKTPFTEDDLNIIFSRTESIWMLLWVINKLDQLDLPTTEAHLNYIFPHLPGFLEPTADFIEYATMRSVSEILDQSDFILRFYWALKEAAARGSETLTFSTHIAYERYFSLNWVTRPTEAW
jgi:hypothetical protein